MVDPFMVGQVARCHFRWMHRWMHANTKKEMQENTRKVYREHYELVRKLTPPEHLLEFEFTNG
jgi:hypothetical protein